MKGFRYKHGDRPLEGYTIQRAAGKGGFGEVYYAVSDSGREVALKVISGYEQIELRGVSQCMNLKSPHLVTIFDVRHNDEGTPFVIMEFVSGPSLRGLLDESPGGIGSQKSAFFLREIGKGLAYLHECGIVHRDLKPGNIFYENGYVKIGDYGLSKAMSASQHSGQTITVGTVHYMAPEIGMGKYDKGIDIYALGAVLYEMLTGTVPYLGGSPGEILMKHLSAEPDVSNIEEPYATVIKRAMAKNPTERYQSVQEMVEAVFGAEHVRESVSCFSPDSLSMIAQRAAERVAVGVGAGSKTPPPIPPRGGGKDRGADVWEQMGHWVDKAGDRITEFGGRVANAQWWPASEEHGRGAAPVAGPAVDEQGQIHDPLSTRQRLTLGLIVLAVLTITVGVLGAGTNAADEAWFATLMATAAAAAGVLLARHKLLPQLSREGAVVQRLAVGGLAAMFMLIFGGPVAGAANGPEFERLMFSGLAALVPLFLLDWVEAMSARREQRVMLGHAVMAGAVALVGGIILPGYAFVAIAVAAGTSLLVQVLSPWHNPKGGVIPSGRGFEPVMREVPVTAGGAPAEAQAAAMGKRTWFAWQGEVNERAAAEQLATPAAAPQRRVSRSARLIWLGLMTALLPLGVMLVVFPNVENIHDDFEFGMFVGFGVGALLLGAICFLKSFQTRFHGWWRYLVKPLVQWACVQTIIVSGVAAGSMNGGEEVMVAVFFIVISSIVLLLVTFMRVRDEGTVAPLSSAGPTPRPGSAEASMAGAADVTITMGAHMNRAMASPGVMPAQAASVTMRSGYDVPHQRSFVHTAAAMVGWAVLVVGVVLGLMTAIDLPGMLFLQTPVSSTYRGPSPGLVRLMMGVGTFVVMLVASGLLMGARRPLGLAHVLRALFAVVALGGCIGFVYGAFAHGGGLRASAARARGVEYPRWSAPIQVEVGDRRHANPSEVIERYIEDIQTAMFIPAGLFAAAGATLLAWPARRRDAGSVDPVAAAA